MRLLDLVGMAFRNLWRRKLRTFLTVLAVVIGAMLVALMQANSAGLQDFIVNQFGTIVSPQSIYASSDPSDTTMNFIMGTRNETPRELTSASAAAKLPFSTADLDKLRAIPGVEQVDFTVFAEAEYIQPAGSQKMFSVALDILPSYSASLHELLAGTYFSDDDAGRCLLPYDYLKLFGWTDAESAIGQQVTIVVGKANPYEDGTASYTFTVVGVIKKTTNTAVIVPLQDGLVVERFYQDNPLLDSEAQPGSFLELKAADASKVDSIAAAVRDMGFSATTPGEMLASINGIFRVIQIGLAAFGVIALIVASIGIINTLLMSIYERTREIGVMKAVGARRSSIRGLFTLEGGILGFMGGVFGVGLAYAAGLGLNYVGARTFLASYPGFELSIFTYDIALLVVALTTAISLLAALYPANRAAGLNTVDALRYE